MSAEAHYPSPEGEVVNAAAHYPSPEGSEHSWAVAGQDEDLNFGPLMAQQDPEDLAATAAIPQAFVRQSASGPRLQDDWHSVNARLVAMRTLQYKYPWEHSSRSVRPRLNVSQASLFSKSSVRPVRSGGSDQSCASNFGALGLDCKEYLRGQAFACSSFC